jgi:hypothetical protein
MSTKHMDQMEIPFDFANRRFITVDGSNNDQIALTTVKDLTYAVARDIDFKGGGRLLGVSEALISP